MKEAKTELILILREFEEGDEYYQVMIKNARDEVLVDLEVIERMK